MLCDAKSLKREALKPGGARAEVCVRLLNAESSSQPAGSVGPLALPVKTSLSRCPEGSSLDARTIRTIQHVIGLAVRVEIGCSDQSIAVSNGRPECASDKRGARQIPDC